MAAPDSSVIVGWICRLPAVARDLNALSRHRPGVAADMGPPRRRVRQVSPVSRSVVIACWIKSFDADDGIPLAAGQCPDEGGGGLVLEGLSRQDA